MTIANVLKRIARGMGTTPEKAAMDYCFAHGFTAGKNFQYNSGYPIDANWPWLISIGDNVTLSSNVRILAHDASTVKAGAHTKIGIVRIGNNVFIGADSVVLCNDYWCWIGGDARCAIELCLCRKPRKICVRI